MKINHLLIVCSLLGVAPARAGWVETTVLTSSETVGIRMSPFSMTSFAVTGPAPSVDFGVSGYFWHDGCTGTNECAAVSATIGSGGGPVAAWANLGTIIGGTVLAGQFGGDVEVNGMLMKGGGGFIIDHPLEPKGKVLRHSFVESPDMMNLYNGIAVLDSKGEAVVKLPDYFSVLNSDFRYSLTALGAPAPGLYIKTEAKDNQFAIAGGNSGQRVSWQVTGVRQDAFAKDHRLVVEESKSNAIGHQKGKYIHAQDYGADEEKEGESGEAIKARKKRPNKP